MSWARSATARGLALTILFSAAAVYEAVHVSALLAPGIWEHLRTGLWMLQNHMIPRTGLFSQYPNLPWTDSSWAFDLLLAAAYRLVGLRALPILLMLLKVALAGVIFLLARAGRAGFWAAILLSVLAQYLIAGLQPLPSVLSILLFAVELRLLVRSRQSGELRELFWLPLLFVLWANLDDGFVFGLLLLGLFLLALLSEHLLRSLGPTWVSDRIRPLDLGRVGIIAVFSVVATFANPYTFHPLADAFPVLYSHVGFEHFTEMSAMAFRRPQDFVLMLLVMTAFLALGRRRSLDGFALTTMLAGTLIAFRLQREGWLAVFPAIVWIADGLSMSSNAVAELGVRRQRLWAGALTAILVIIAATLLPNSNSLMNKVSQNFPVKACDYIRDNHLSPPLYNAYSWGSFLTWYLPEYPVVVDSRVELYGDDIIAKYFETAGGKQRLESDPAVAQAHTLLLEKESAMAKALINLPGLSSQYRLVYTDDLASVFVPQSVGQQ